MPAGQVQPPARADDLRAWLGPALQGKNQFFKRGGVTLSRPDFKAHLFMDLQCIRIVVAPILSGVPREVYSGPLDGLGKKLLKPIRRLYADSCALPCAARRQAPVPRNDGATPCPDGRDHWFHAERQREERRRFREATRAQNRNRGATASEDLTRGKSISHSTDLE